MGAPSPTNCQKEENVTPGTALETVTLDEGLQAFFSADPAFVHSPYPFFARLRREAPVYRSDSGTIVVSSHAGVKQTLHDHKTLPVPQDRGGAYGDRTSLLNDEEVELYRGIVRFEQDFIQRKNGADHDRVRKAGQKALTPRRVAALATSIQHLTDEYLDKVQYGQVDFMEFANWLPLMVVMELLGAPREDAPLLKRFGDAVHAPFGENPLTPETVRHSAQSVQEYKGYAAELVERVRAIERNGGKVSETNLVSDLMAAEEGGQITASELIATFMVLLFAGHETTANLIGNGFFALLTHSREWEKLIGDPEASPTAVEELFRYDGPAVAAMREAALDFNLGGVDIKEGEPVVALLSSANRDEEMFSNPTELDIARKPNVHFGLGVGMHFCLGAPLARLEGRIAFETLARRVPNSKMDADPETIRYHPHVILRGIESLPVTLAA